MNYFIFDGYVPRLDNEAFDDRPYTDGCQKEVYQYAAAFAKEKDLQFVADFGCGAGYKLIKHLGQLKTVGIDIEPAYSYCVATYPTRNWLLSDLNVVPHISPDYILCSDVIEHLVNPDQLLAYVKKIAPRYATFSTPDRDMIPGGSRSGPPHNLCHVREWNAAEFKAYLSSWFSVVEHTKCGLDTQIVTVAG